MSRKPRNLKHNPFEPESFPPQPTVFTLGRVELPAMPTPGILVQPAPFYEHNESVVLRQRAHIRTLETKIEQLEFLLSQAPIRLAPANLMEAAHSVTKYAYINRMTFMHNVAPLVRGPIWNEPYYTIAPSPTKWVMTDLVPVGVCIYTPNEMPHITINLQDLMHGEKP